MKSFLIVICLCLLALHSGSASRFDNLRECIAGQGYENKQEVMSALLSSNLNTMPDVSKEKLACAVACALQKINPHHHSIHTLLSEAINYVANLSDDKRKQMLDTLNTCQVQAGKDDCKLLDCVKITESDFLDLFLVITHMPADSKFCIFMTDLKADDIRKMRKSILTSEPLDEATATKMSCLMGCVFHKTKRPHQEIAAIISEAITSDDSIAVDQKKQMWETLNECVKKVGINDCKLMNCIKINSDPFKSVFSAVNNAIKENADWLVWIH